VVAGGDEALATSRTSTQAQPSSGQAGSSRRIRRPTTSPEVPISGPIRGPAMKPGFTVASSSFWAAGSRATKSQAAFSASVLLFW